MVTQPHCFQDPGTVCHGRECGVHGAHRGSNLKRPSQAHSESLVTAAAAVVRGCGTFTIRLNLPAEIGH